MTDPPRVRIHYRRPPDRVQVFDQRVVVERPDVVVTLAERMTFDPAMRIDDSIVLEDGSSVVWFTFPDTWHDVGRFHRADGTFTGLYANILTPPDMRPGEWHTTDLFLDVWLPPGGPARLLDQDEFERARGRELLDEETARRAQEEAARILDAAARGAWPPPVVREWTLERCLSGGAAPS